MEVIDHYQIKEQIATQSLHKHIEPAGDEEQRGKYGDGDLSSSKQPQGGEVARGTYKEDPATVAITGRDAPAAATRTPLDLIRRQIHEPPQDP
uniref:Uncharacterized protein n=1 Tax=Leersia perrieri TaxID=77586 RepID=A0A0D9X713_9ORYZ